MEESVTIVDDFSPGFDPPFRWLSKHQTKNHSEQMYINNLVSSEFTNKCRIH